MFYCEDGGSFGLKSQCFTAKRGSFWTEKSLFYCKKGCFELKSQCFVTKQGVIFKLEDKDGYYFFPVRDGAGDT